MRNLYIENVKCYAKAFGLFFRNFILVSLKPPELELLEFLIIFITSPVVMGGILKPPVSGLGSAGIPGG